MSNFWFSPAFLFIFGGLFVAFFKGRLKWTYMLALPSVAFLIAMQSPEGSYWTVSFLGHDLVFGKIDRLSRVFLYIFTIISFISVTFAIKVEDDLQHGAAFAYAGGALGVVLAGDLITLYLFWEIMAVSSTFLILARRTVAAQKAAFRYVLVHIVGGLCLLAGIVLHLAGGNTAMLGPLSLSSVATVLMFIGIAVNAAIPPLHPWLPDAYPEATPTGAVFLSAFTTKSAVYVMARMFPGAELLIWLGAIMTVFPIFYAVLENDIRRVLSYSLMNQVGFMMCGVGIGTALAINGTVSHAFCHILYKALLFMAAGSVLHVTGKIRCTDLGGLYKTMPLTCLFCIIGSASISAFPLFSGFVSKSMIISAAGHDKLVVIWLMLQFASAGVVDHAGIKVPYFMFFSHDSGIRVNDPPINMRIAMGMAAFFCIFLGVYPQPLYDILPYPVDYIPYTGAHVVGQLQLLCFAILAFCLLILAGKYPAEIRAINVDADWFYRKGSRLFYRLADGGLNGLNRVCDALFARRLAAGASRFANNAPARLSLMLANPFLSDKTPGPDGFHFKRKILAALKTGSIPIGFSAAGACIIVVVLYLLT